MTALHANLQKRLKDFDFKGLFTQELMWNHFQTRDLEVKVDSLTYTLTPVAQRGMAVYECVPSTDGDFPKYATRRKIDTQVSKTAREHIIIFHDRAKSVQIWQWVKREAGKPSACREQLFYSAQSGDALIQKIQSIAFSLEDEANVAESAERVGAAFDVDKVTKKFYELFKKEHDTFLKFVSGIPDEELKRWYVSVMLNRLMFIYFIQKKGFLGGDQHYLTNKLADFKKRGKDKFYRDFLCVLFFHGFAERPEHRGAEISSLLGQVPYLNGGLFLLHEIEKRRGKHIEIPDKAFDRVFAFFEQYDWHLDDRPTHTGREINPDVLGYVFEKYINQRDMGAYYTKEDITEFIGKNTIIPALFDMVRKSCRIAFEGEHSVWRLLQAEPDRYIHSVMLRGIQKDLPQSIAVGLNDVSKRADWNKPADSEFALPTETWREVVARRSRCGDLRKKLAAGEIRTTDDLITHNLDLRRFAEDIILNEEHGSELVWSFYEAIHSVSVLDPTCGSGAFLFAALNILEPLYDACLVRMEAFLDDLKRSAEKHRPEKMSHFREVLEQVHDKSLHPHPHYFILKSIILNNLYGVDIMEEATEICKLRLFLKLVAQVDANDKIEPLPDIDFNIRAGNTLVGFSTEDELKHVLGSSLDFDNKMLGIKERAELAGLAYQRFREMQVRCGQGAGDFSEAKSEVQQRLLELRTELDSYLSGEYRIRGSDKHGLEKWRHTHQPFHWFVEFYRILVNGGFDAVIGNPPYVVYPSGKVSYRVLDSQFVTITSRNLYAYIFEQSVKLAKSTSHVGLIVQLTAISSERMEPLQSLLQRRGMVYAVPFPRRPQSVFTDVEMPVVILISAPVNVQPNLVATNVNRFYAQERPHVTERVRLVRHSIWKNRHRIAKVGSELEVALYNKLAAQPIVLGTLACSDSEWLMYYQEACRYWVKAIEGQPFFKRNGKRIEPPHGRTIHFTSRLASSFATCLLNSSLFYWLYSAMCDCEHINDGFVREFSIPTRWDQVDWRKLSDNLMKHLTANATRKTISTKQGHKIEYDEMNAMQSKAFIDEIDAALADAIGLSPEELDFVTNYDIKYRMGSGSEEANTDEFVSPAST